MLVKLNLFRDTASMLNGFLIKFQSDSPLVPFLSDCLEDLMPSMMGDKQGQCSFPALESCDDQPTSCVKNTVTYCFCRGFIYGFL